MDGFVIFNIVTLLLVHYGNGQTTVLKVTYSFVEDLPPLSPIGDIIQDADLEALQGTYFEFFHKDPKCPHCFLIEPTTGILKSNITIDRDAICPGAETCELVLEIKRQPVQYFQLIDVKVTVEDLNDNPPRFTPNTHVLIVSEVASTGSSYNLPTAKDPDSPQFGIVAYEMIPTLDEFELEETNGPFGIGIRLVLKAKLDREILDIYQAQILCRDGGNPAKTGTLQLTISVSDYNDNPPIFTNKRYYFEIAENIAPPVNIGQVLATDADIGENGEILYSLEEGTHLKFDSVFQIGSQSGIINTFKSLDREEISDYQLTIEAKDKGSEPLSSFTEVLVKVLDINDNPPKITINNAVNNSVSVPETNNTNTSVAHITIIDPDSGSNGEFSCSLDTNLFILKHIARSEYNLIATSPLDRETIASYSLKLKCQDKGVPSLESTVPIIVKLLDVNDVTPLFNQTVYYMHVMENTPIDVRIGQVFAFDYDEGINGEIVYHLSPDAYDLVTIHPNNGIIRANYAFDYEKMKQFTFHVIAWDKSPKPRSSTCEVRLTIIDTNDEGPIFSQSSYKFGVTENQPSGTQVGNVVATDADSPLYNHFIYILEGPNGETDIAFTINHKNGTIVTGRPVDREEEAIHYLKVIARDQSSPYWSSSASVTVFIWDENDNAPIIDFPNATYDTVYVSTKTRVGATICKILAHDVDDGSNAQLTYSMQTYDANVPFTVHPISGDVVLKSLVNGDTSYTVRINVMDNGKIPLAAEASLTIKFNSTLAPVGPSGGNSTEIVGQPPQPSNHNIVIIIALSVVFTVLILFLAAVLIVLKCSRRKDTNQGPYVIYETRENSSETGDLPPEVDLKKPVSPQRHLGSQEKKYLYDDNYHPDVTEGGRCDIPRQGNTTGYEPAFTQVCHWLRHQVDPLSDADSACSNSDSGRGTEEGDVTNSGGSRDTSTEDATHHPGGVTKSPDKGKQKRVCFSDSVTDINKRMNERMVNQDRPSKEPGLASPKILVKNGHRRDNPVTNLTRAKQSSIPLGVIDVHRNNLLYGKDCYPNLPCRRNLTNQKGASEQSTNCPPPRPPRSSVTKPTMEARPHSTVSEDTCSDDGGSTTSGSYVVDLADFDDVGPGTVV